MSHVFQLWKGGECFFGIWKNILRLYPGFLSVQSGECFLGFWKIIPRSEPCFENVSYSDNSYIPKGENKESKKRRVFRSGAGIEVSSGVGDTEGFPLRQDPAIVKDFRGFRRLELPRYDRRTVKTSSYLLQGWRGKCDIQLLLYDDNPCDPDPEEIA